MVLKKDLMVFFPSLAVLAIAYVIGAYIIAFKPVMGEAAFNTSANLAFSAQASILLLACAWNLKKSWEKGGKRNPAHFYWGVGFLLLTIVFLSKVLDALGVEIADMSQPHLFFMWHQFMILWVALMYYGIAKITFPNKALQQIPTGIIILGGYSLFAYGAIIKHSNPFDVMYGFLNLLLIPTCFLIAYLFYTYWKESKTEAPKNIALGFFGISVTYWLWLPWQASDVGFVWYALFNLSLVALLIGLQDIKCKQTIIKPKK